MNTMRTTLALSLLCVGTCAPRTGFGQDAAATAHSVSGNIALVSDYRFRAISQTYGQPAVQGGLDYAAPDGGFYLGTWASSVSGNLYMNGAGLEWDFYGGYKFAPVDALNLDVGLYEYVYPGAHYNDADKTRYDNTELYAGAIWRWFSAKYWYALSDYFGVNERSYGGYVPVLDSRGSTDPTRALPDDRGGSKGSGYLDLNAVFSVAEKTTLTLHAGRLEVKNYGELSYTDYKISLARDVGWAVLSAAAITSDADAKWYRYCESNARHCKDPTGAALVIAVSRAL